MSKEFDYSKLRHVTSVDQSDRKVPYNLRQSGPTKVEMLISTRVRKSPYWHLSMQAGCWRATVYNRIYHPRGLLDDKYDCIQLLSNNQLALINANMVIFLHVLKLTFQLLLVRFVLNYKALFYQIDLLMLRVLAYYSQIL